MSNKIIYVVPEPGSNTPLKGHDSGTIDLFFHVNDDKGQPYTGKVPFYRSSSFTCSLGVKTYPTPEAGDYLILPRSSASSVLGGTFSQHPAYSQDGVPLSLNRVKDIASIHLLNTVGLIDRDYRGIVMARARLEVDMTDVTTPVLLDLSKPWFQAWSPNPEVKFLIVPSIEEVPEEIRTTSRGAGGFGSSNNS